MEDCIEVICSRCTYRCECGPFKDCVPKKILLNEMAYRTASQPEVVTTVKDDGTVIKDIRCSKCKHYFFHSEIENGIKFCPNCGQKLDWSVSCDK